MVLFIINGRKNFGIGRDSFWQQTNVWRLFIINQADPHSWLDTVWLLPFLIEKGLGPVNTLSNVGCFVSLTPGVSGRMLSIGRHCSVLRPRWMMCILIFMARLLDQESGSWRQKHFEKDRKVFPWGKQIAQHGIPRSFARKWVCASLNMSDLLLMCYKNPGDNSARHKTYEYLSTGRPVIVKKQSSFDAWSDNLSYQIDRKTS